MKILLDRFGCGFIPWISHPAYLIIFTDSKYCMEGHGAVTVSDTYRSLSSNRLNHIRLSTQHEKVSVKTPEKKGNGIHLNDLIYEPYRWDQKLFFFVLLSHEEQQVDPKPSSDLFKLASVRHPPSPALCGHLLTPQITFQMTGGDVFFCKNLKDAIEAAKNLLVRISATEQSVIVKLSVEKVAFSPKPRPVAAMEEGEVTEAGSEGSKQPSKPKILVCELRCRNAASTKQWPISESCELFYSHQSAPEAATPSSVPLSVAVLPGWSLLFRSSYCDLADTVCSSKVGSHSANANAGAMEKGTSLFPVRAAHPMLHLCRVVDSSATDILRACEELSVPADRYTLDLSLTQFRQQQQSKLFFFQLLQKVAASTKDSCIVVYLKVKGHADRTVASGATEIPNSSFGLIQATSLKSSGQVELVLLPFNFHILLPLLLLGCRLREHMDSSKIRLWRHNITAYMHSCPAYYHVLVWQLFANLDLVQFAALPPSAVLVSAKAVSAAMQHVQAAVKVLEQSCLVDLIALDSAAKYEGCSYEGLSSVMEARPVAVLALQSPADREAEIIPPALSQLHCSDLLFTWEHMRKHIYGGLSSSQSLPYFLPLDFESWSPSYLAIS